MSLNAQLQLLNPSLSDLLRWRKELMETRFTGVRSLRDQNGEEITFRSDSELRQAIVAINNEIAAVNGTAPNTIHFRTSKGI